MKKNKILILKFLLLVLFQGGNSLQSAAQAVDTIDFPQADLTRASQQVYPEKANPGSYITVFSKVYNAGFGIAPSNRTDYYLTTDTSWTLPDKVKAYFLGSSYLPPLPSQSTLLDSAGLYIPKDIVTGVYFLVSYTDAGNEVYEINEFNNRYIFPINIGTSSPSVDLYPTFLSVDDSLIVSNQAIASLGESNLGTDFSGSYEVGFYLSKDSTLDDFDNFLVSKKSDGLAGNTSSYSDVKIPLPSLSQGWYYLIAALDVYNAVSETLEYNNTIARRFYISGNGFADLVLDSARIENPNRLSPGDSITLSFIERNIGTGSAGEHYTNFYLSTSPYIDPSAIALSKTFVSGLNAQDGIYKSEYAVIPADLPSGFYYLIAQADSYNSVSESDEHNNTNVTQVTIGTTDVDLTTVMFDSTITVLRGDYFNANGYVSNIGSVFTSSSYMGFYLSKDSRLDSSDTFVQSQYIDYLYAGDLRYFYTSIPTYNFEPGMYYLIAKADYLNYVAESNEENNIAYVPVNIVLPNVDLSITSLFTKDTILTSGNSFNVSYSITNSGTYYANSSYTNFYLSKDSIVDEYDYLIGQSYEPYVSDGSTNFNSANSYIPSSIAEGLYYLIARADDYEYVSESNEFNNDAFIQVKVKAPMYDIAISDLSKSSEMVTAGSSLNVRYYESNLGDVTFPEYYTGFVLSSDTIYNDSIDINLGTYYRYDSYPGNVNYFNQYLYIPATVPAGNYYLIAKTDAYNFVTETNEYNNSTYTKIKIITPNVDLSVNTQRVNPAKAVAGNTINVSGYLYNHGTEYSYSTNLNFYISKSENTIADSAFYLGSYYSSSVNPEASVPFNQTLYLPEYFAAGEYFIVFVADAGNNQPEMNENNNIVSKKISIEAATRDLFVKSASVNSKVTVEQTVYFKATISNSGNSDVSYFNLGYYLSSDEALSSDDIFIGTIGVPGMLSKSSVPVSGEFIVPYYISQGSYKLLFVADNYNHITETNEMNNTLAKGLLVTNPYGDQNNEDTISEPAFTAPVIAISVVPNPVGEFINVSVQTTEASTLATYELYDSFGNKFKGGNQNITNGKFSIPASGIITGVYVLKVAYEGKVETIRIIKE
jgi:subtilase family serine protease